MFKNNYNTMTSLLPPGSATVDGGLEQKNWTASEIDLFAPKL